MYPQVSIIILNWNGKKDTIDCLESLKNITYPNYEILLVDNGSTDGSVDCFREQYPEIEIIENKENLGFAEGNNIAIRKIVKKETKYILLLNNDTVVDKRFLDELIKVAESNQNIGILGPTIYYYSQPNKIQSAGAKILWNKGRDSISRHNELDVGEYNKIEEVDYVSGCALLAKVEVFKKIGCLNKHYFAYWEETDLCIRAHDALYKVLYVPKAKIWHKGGSTSKKTNGFIQYHMTRNMFWFMKQHATRKQYISFLLYFFGFQFWFSSAIYIIHHKNINAFLSLLKGSMDGIKRIHR